MGFERKLRLFIYARILVTFLFLASTILAGYNGSASVDLQMQNGMVRLMAFSFLFSVCCLFCVRVPHIRSFVAYLQTIWDLLFVTVLLLFTGGVASPYSFLYLLSIMGAGVLLGRRDALYTASLCAILYGTVVDFQYFGLLAVIGLSQSVAQQIGPTGLFYTIFLNLMGFCLAAAITGHLSARARESEQALREKSITYDELEHLSSSIVSNLESGLLTVTLSGRVMVFNRSAEEITGLKQADIRGAELGSIFPAVTGQLESADERISGEFEYRHPDGTVMTLGYTAVPLTGAKGMQTGTIMNFRDLTAIKRMEAHLKRTDRLAALGEISARMAHEIRNPLTAMSGSVQLLAEQGTIPEGDRRLLGIVLRETERLNRLITDFLAYARPSAPNREPIGLKQMVDDMIVLITTDERSGAVSFRNLVPEHLQVRADPGQLKQVLLNLFRNSVDAMPEGGAVEIESCFRLNGAEGFHKGPAAVITVTDNGCGFDSATDAHLFEPFWTTKPEGSGLGLAIIYRIIDAHGGTIRAESPPEGGCRFTIMLPT
jgi:two-component system sensor histidine kinase PilS (NtrC family)